VTSRTLPLRKSARAAAAPASGGPGRFGASGWLRGATRVPSPNCDARPTGTLVTLAVIHNISLPPGQFGGADIVRLFTNTLNPAAHPYYAGIAHLKVSAHFLIRRDGTLVQFVPCDFRAWHAGASSWRGRERCNDFSIGIELEGTDERPYTAKQYARLARVLSSVRRLHPITDVVGHRDIAPGRKTDPGPAFDWDRLRRLVPWSRRRARPAR
jgi:AmpD protein